MRPTWIGTLFCLLLLVGCASTPKAHKESSGSGTDESPFSNNLSGNPIVFPLQTIPRRNHRRYINHNGGEAIVFYYAGKAHILSRATEQFGAFQFVPYASTEDPVVLPLATGQVFVAAADRVLIRDACPDPTCSVTESLSTPTQDKPLAFDQDSESGGKNASTVFMVNGTRWVYSYDLLQRKWDHDVPMPEGVQGVAVERIGTETLVLDRTGNQAWIHEDRDNGWRKIAVPSEPDDPVTQVALVGNNMVLANKRALWVTTTDKLFPKPSLNNSQKTRTPVAWWRSAAPSDMQIVQISSDANYLYCTTDSGDIFRIAENELGSGASPILWLNFEPSLIIPIEHEPIQRLRWINGELLAFSADGVSHSKDLGMSWARETHVPGPPVRLDEITLAGRSYAVTRTFLLEADSEEPNNERWHLVKQLSDGCVVAGIDDGTADSAPTLEAVNDHTFAIITAAPGDAAQGVCLFDARAGKLTQLSSGWQPSKMPLSMVSVADHLILGSDHGLTIWDPRKASWNTSDETVPFDGHSPDGGVTAVARYGNRGVILATESRAIYFREAWDSGHPWKRMSDKFDSVRNLVNGNLRIISIWVNPERLSEIYLLLNQTSAINLYYRDRADSMFVLSVIGNDRATGLAESGAGDLWVTGLSNSYYINRNRPPIGSMEDVIQRFEDRGASKLSEPITWVAGLLGSYVIAVICVLALRFLPMSSVLGRSWLASQIVKPFTVSPLVGRWILFLGYRTKVRKETAAQGLYFGLPALLPDGTSVAPDEDGGILCEKLLQQLRQSRSLLLIGRPGSGKSMLLTRLANSSVAKRSRAKRLLPILITADIYTGDLIESASKLLRERYGIPVDKEDVLIGQMQVGGIMFLFDGLSEVSISRSSAVADLLRVTRMPEFKKCSLIISSRSFEGQPEISTAQVLPVRAADAVKLYLPHFTLPAEEAARVNRSLLAFRDQPVDMQLLMMAIEYKGTGVFQNRYEIFRAFFQKRLAAEGVDGAERWGGWSFALEHLARCFCLDTGVKSQGLSQRATVDAMNSIMLMDSGRSGSRDLVTELRDTYNIEMTTEVSVLNYLRTVGILVRLDRWKFAHDSFEEFFCASYLARVSKNESILPHVVLWQSRPEELCEVFGFLGEILGPEQRAAICSERGFAEVWRDQVVSVS